MQFTYTGTDAQGRPASGTVEAHDRASAVQALRAQGTTVLELVPLPADPDAMRKPLRGADLIQFCRHLAYLTEAELPLPDALRALATDARRPAFRAAFERMAQGLETGESLDTMLEREHEVFPPLLPAMVRAGQASGSLSRTLRLAAAHATHMHALHRSLFSAVAYPLIVLVLLVALAVTAFVFVVPRFRDVFIDMGVDLPLPTALVLGISEHLALIGIIVFGLLALLALLFRWLDGLAPCVSLKRWILFHLPLYGRILKSAFLVRFSRFLTLFLTAGLPLDHALTLLAHLDRGAHAPRDALDLADMVRDGTPLAGAMHAQTTRFPAFLCWVVRTTEQTGRLPEALDEVAGLYQEQVEHDSQLLTGLLPALTLAVLGALVGGCVLSLFLPIFEMQMALGK